MTFRPLIAALALGAGLIASTALAHPKLVSSVPAANATVGSTRTIRLNFSERLTPRLSTATLTMTGMPGMPNHGEMKMTGVTSALSPDGKAIILTSERPLRAGSYRADWVVVGDDTHRITGQHSFSVR